MELLNGWKYLRSTTLGYKIVWTRKSESIPFKSFQGW